MITILPIRPRVQREVDRHNLAKKFEKQIRLFSQNPAHPSLNVELLEPKDAAVYSFRIDRKYRALFVYDTLKRTIEIIAITVHYQ